MHRLFVALHPPAPIREQLQQTMAGVPEARWQDDEQLHLTLRYIGEVDGHVAEDIATALGSVHAPAPEVRLAGVGQFGSRGRVHALWAGLTPHDALNALHRKVDQALIRAGLEPERRAYLPHITLARLATREATVSPWLAVHAGLASPAFRLDHLILYESHLGHAGARYEPVTRYALTADSRQASPKRSPAPTNQRGMP